jgi:lipoprotein-anchoring transpeptidase ErfK/SrfK
MIFPGGQIMREMSRRSFLLHASAANAVLLLGACASTSEDTVALQPAIPQVPAVVPEGVDPNYASVYGSVEGERFPVLAVDLAKVNPAFLRSEVAYSTTEAPGSIVVDPAGHYLYFIEPGGMATRYGVGVGKQGFEWSGVATINSKQEWPDWYPPPEMVARRPDIAPLLTDLQSGRGMPGGAGNPIGARGLYLWQDNKDTLYRIHGTIEPESIGKSVSSGCIRMINQDVIHLYGRVAIGTEVKVLPAKVV